MITITPEEAQKYTSIFKSLESEFEKRQDRFEDIRDLIAVGTGSFKSELDEDDVDHDIDYGKLLDSEHLEYFETLCSGLYGGLVNPSGEWFDVVPRSTYLFDDVDAMDYCYSIKKAFELLFHATNFYKEFKMTCNEYPVYGFAPMMIEEDKEHLVKFTHFTCGEAYLGCDFDGVYNQLAREIRLTPDQLVSYFGYDNCTLSVQKAFDERQFDRKFTVYHLICPNYKRNNNSRLSSNMPYVDLYWMRENEKAFNEIHVLKKSGYRENPLAVFFWMKKNKKQVYPLGIGGRCLGDVKELQNTSYNGSVNEAFLMNPAMALHTSLSRQPILPGSTFYTEQDPTKVASEIRRVQSHIEEIENKKQLIKQRIRKLTMADIMLLFATKDKDRMTAREVIAIINEQAALLGGIYLNAKDSLTQVFKRVFAIGLRKGYFPMPPDSLAGDGINVEFTSNIAKVQRMTELQGISDLALYTGQYAQMKPEILDNLDEDKVFAELISKLSVNTKVRKNPKIVQQIREQRAQQQAAAAQAEQMESITKAAKNASGATLSQDNLLGAMAQQNGMAVPNQAI